MDAKTVFLLALSAVLTDMVQDVAPALVDFGRRSAYACEPHHASSCLSFIATPDNHMKVTSADCFQGYPFPRSPAASVVVWPNHLAPSHCFAGDVIHTTAKLPLSKRVGDLRKDYCCLDSSLY
ncbi:hypothetical protein HPB51_019731 [Rhipicephalus microplus]|uniref:Secreted protein n=1 Tax=Rhipicephalus microplus TaxID=6941 RepID=A0A9J6F5E8_RHIMP|nr:hypothetical protein HPB51_019731 [Rhipicephalus microplus]